MGGFVRARKPEQKEERRAHLVATARALVLGTRGVDGLGLNELARRAGMTKSNVYRYFESREAVLLALLEDEYEAWLHDLRAELPAPRAAPSAPRTRPPRRGPSAPVGSKARSVDVLSSALARSLVSRPVLVVLTSALPTVLEKNLSEEAIVAFKLRSAAFFDEVAGVLEPYVPRDIGVPLMHDVVAALGGLYPYACPAEAVRRALARPELSTMARDLEADLTRFVRALANDWLSQRRLLARASS
jgi:AcrR family transcriptional regulator